MPTSNSARRVPHPPPSAANVFLFLVAFRLLNALAVRTFFQPDEFFQSLEPAWQIAFGHGEGKETGAWVTWEWNHQLRSSLHPLLFAAIYRLADLLASLLGLSGGARAEFLIAGPKTAQAVVSAIGDFYTWKLATRIYGSDSRGAWATLIVTILNPWQWFCSTRTLSNCLETTITIVALNLWPWQRSTGVVSDDGRKNMGNGRSTAEDRRLVSSLRQCLCLAALACILRPTNVLIWATLASVAWVRTTWAQRKTLAREVLICGSAIIIVSAIADRLFYGIWTFPPLRFLYFNIAQSLAVFYGRNDWHYYASQGFPLLLTTALPFALIGLYQTLKNPDSTAVDKVQTAIRVQLATVCLVMPFVLSLISHKEVRFIYPLLPALHILAAPPLVQFFYPAMSSRSSRYTPRRLTLVFLVFASVVIALYPTLWHASGVLNVLTYLRQQHEAHSSDRKQTFPSNADTNQEHTIAAGFLMPCHSTPWRSHLVYPTIDAWALSCEPPIDFTDEQKTVYRDEADQFYDDPAHFLRQNMGGGLRHLPRRPSYASGPRPLSAASSSNTTPQHEWPDYLIFFAQLEPTLHNLLRGSSYGECWRTWNTAWHDDWRRRGDIIVWCLDSAEQDAWRSKTQQQLQENRDRLFARFVKAIKREARQQQWSGWKSLFPSSLPWPWSPSSTSSFSFSPAKWQRSMRSFFSTRSSFSWPWTPPAREDAFWTSMRRWTLGFFKDWTPSLPQRLSLPSWLGGKSKKSAPERDLWS